MTFAPDSAKLISLRPRPSTFQVSRGRTSLVTAQNGDIHSDRPVEGLYIYNTRVLSRYAWRLNGKEPGFSTASNVEQFSWLGYYIQAPENCKETPAHLCNPLEETLELRISRAVGEGMHEDVYLTNHTQIATPVKLELEFELAFESQDEAEKGRKQKGELKVEKSQPSPGVWELSAHYSVDHKYSHQGNEGVAHMKRGAILRIENATSEPKIDKHHVTFEDELAPHQEWHACVSWLAIVDESLLPLSCACNQTSPSEWDQRRAKALSSFTHFSVPHDNDLSSTVQRVLQRSAQDLEILRLHDLEAGTHKEHGIDGIAVAAGVPTYQEIFGRDMEASSWQAAMLSPQFLRGTLNTLNPLAATEKNDWRDAEPGRLPHEIHTDPLSVLDFRPKDLYFGSVTSCILFPIAVSELWHWSGDLNLVRKYVDTAIGAIQWADKYSLDDTGFYRYKTRSEQGVKNQGWKDSNDAIVYPDGSQVKAPIGTCEMQAFMFAAKLHFSELLFRVGQVEAAQKLYRESQDLKSRFNDRFWMEEEGYIALGIDDKGELIRSIASDPGQCLLSGIVDESRVKQVANRMMQPDMFSGWGIRTLSARHPAYNPYAYHRGTVWPVTNAVFVLAFSRYGLHGEMHQLAKAVFESATLFEQHRLPEVFCGHPRTAETPFPGMYTQANWPQAWSASAPFTIMQAILGIYPYAPARVLFLDPHLPEWLPEITVNDMKVGDAAISLRFYRKQNGETDYQIVDVRGTLHVLRQPSPWSLTSGWPERVGDAISSLLPHRKAS